jgi:hypothetical protein
LKPSRESLAASCHFEAFSFGSIRIDGVTHEHDVPIDRGHVSQAEKEVIHDSGHLYRCSSRASPWKRSFAGGNKRGEGRV